LTLWPAVAVLLVAQATARRV